MIKTTLRFDNRKMANCFMNGKSCIYERPIDSRINEMMNGRGEKKAFVIMPFEPYLDAIYKWQLTRFLTQGGEGKEKEFACTPERADDVRQVGYIICEKICKKIQEANLIVVDLSFDNPNVFYEFGISVALRKPILPICIDQKLTDKRKEVLSKLFGIERIISYSIFGDIRGQISLSLLDLNKFAALEQLSGNKLLVVHDGRQIEVPYKGDASQKLTYDFGSLCKSGAKTAISAIFEESNLKLHPELQKVSDTIDTESMADIDITSLELSAILQHFNDSYCVLLDTKAKSPSTYFWLGYIHAIGGFGIPINIVQETPDSKAIENPAFDIIALWHIHFKENEPVPLSNALKNILEFVFIEKSKYLQRTKFWKRILNDNKVSIFLGSLTIKGLGRNTLGDWDYRTAAELTNYLTNIKETMEVTLESPIQKSMSTPDKERIAWLESQLRGKNCILVASSDVNDLTEVALAKLWNKSPFKALEHTDADFDGYIAYKKYKDSSEFLSGNDSTFFRYYKGEKSNDERGFLLRRGDYRTETEIVEPHVLPGAQNLGEVHHLLGHLVITRNPFKISGSSEKWMIILSGISGPATLGLAQMLTGCRYPEFTINRIDTDKDMSTTGPWLSEKANTQPLGLDDNMLEIINNRTFISYDTLSEKILSKLNAFSFDKGIEMLVKIAVYYPPYKQEHDERKIIAWNFEDVTGKIGSKVTNPRNIIS